MMVSRRHIGQTGGSNLQAGSTSRLQTSSFADCQQQPQQVATATGCSNQQQDACRRSGRLQRTTTVANAAARCEQQHQQDASNSISMQAGSRNKLWSKHRLQTKGSRLRARTATGCKQQQRAASKAAAEACNSISKSQAGSRTGCSNSISRL